MQQTTDPKVFNEVFGGIIAMSLWLQGAHCSFDSSSAVQIRCSKLFHRLAFVCILLDQVKIFKKKKKVYSSPGFQSCLSARTHILKRAPFLKASNKHKKVTSMEMVYFNL